MADTTTPNLTLVQPEVGASTDTWGNKLNADLGTIDNLFNSMPALLILHGGTQATDAPTARANLGCGTMATQNANAVAISGGTIDNTVIGGATPSTIHVSSITFSGDSTQQFSAAVSYTVGFQTVTTNTALSATYQEHCIKADATSGSLTVTLFPAAGNNGRKVQIKKMDGTQNVVNIASAGGLVEGGLAATIYKQNNAYTFISDGTNWVAF